MKSSHLKRHFTKKHNSLKNKPLEFSKREESELRSNQNAQKSFTAVNSKALEASYRVSLRIAQTGKPHTIGENIILPAAKDIAQYPSIYMQNNSMSFRYQIIQLHAELKTWRQT